MKEEQLFTSEQIQEMQDELEKLREKVANYEWDKTNEMSESWRTIHEMGDL